MENKMEKVLTSAKTDIIITAFSNEERFMLANKFGASGFIAKTTDLQKEIENITSAIALSDKYKG